MVPCEPVAEEKPKELPEWSEKVAQNILTGRPGTAVVAFLLCSAEPWGGGRDGAVRASVTLCKHSEVEGLALRTVHTVAQVRAPPWLFCSLPGGRQGTPHAPGALSVKLLIFRFPLESPTVLSVPPPTSGGAVRPSAWKQHSPRGPHSSTSTWRPGVPARPLGGGPSVISNYC